MKNNSKDIIVNIFFLFLILKKYNKNIFKFIYFYGKINYSQIIWRNKLWECLIKFLEKKTLDQK